MRLVAHSRKCMYLPSCIDLNFLREILLVSRQLNHTLKSPLGSGTVAHICNPCSFWGPSWEDHSSPGVGDQNKQHAKTLTLQKKNKPQN